MWVISTDSFSLSFARKKKSGLSPFSPLFFPPFFPLSVFPPHPAAFKNKNTQKKTTKQNNSWAPIREDTKTRKKEINSKNMLKPRFFLSLLPPGVWGWSSALSRWEWAQLVEESLEWSHLKAQSATRRRRREQKDELARRAARTLGLVQLGELSSIWKAPVWRLVQRRRFKHNVIQRSALPVHERGCLKLFGKLVQNDSNWTKNCFCSVRDHRGGRGP